MINSLSVLTAIPGPYSHNHIVAHSDNGTVTWLDLNRQAEQWQQRLKSESEKYWATLLPNSISFLSFLLAAWRLGKVPVLAAQNHHNLEPPHKAITCQLGRGYAVPIDPDPLNDNSGLALILFTSGSSGTPVAISKTFSQLDAELQLLEQHWGHQVNGSVFTSTVSRQHMYGLPFGLLWPLARGSAFLAKPLHYLESLQSLIQQFPITLISSPTQLDNLPPQLGSLSIHNRVNAIFSAGAPLPPKAAEKCGKSLKPIIEIYGSTETGAVAYREQARTSVWQCLKGITVSNRNDSKQLCIQSPTLDSDDCLEVADLVKVISPTRFELLGRADRIVKVGGNRIALREIEQRIATHPWINEVKIIQLEGRKSRLGAVITLNPSGQAALIDEGRLKINRMLSTYIRHDIEAVATPRYWRYMSRMPVDSQGKTTSRQLKVLFHPEQQPRLPEVLETTPGDQPETQLSVIIRVPETLFYFAGHFPGNPVLPGVVQIQWAQHFAKNLLGKHDQFRSLEALKFQHIIQPGDIVTLQLQWDSVKNKLHFRYRSENTAYSSGRMVFYSNE